MSQDNPCREEALAGTRGPRAVWLRIACALLRVPLPLKILVANAVIVAGTGAAALVVATRLLGGPPSGVVLPLMVGFVVVTLVVSTAINAAVVRLALSPLTLLAGTADKVRRGELRARTPLSPLADRTTTRVVTVFNRMLDSVQSAHERQQELALRVLQAEERERERVAHELYAGTAQTLAGVLIRLRIADREGDGARASLSREIRDEVATALEEIRSLARRLRPPELDELGIRPALDAHARTLTEGRAIRVHVRGHVPESSLTRDAALALFRIVQEAITNAVLHSAGRTVDVRFATRERGLLAEIVDDGAGFDVRDLFTGTEPHLGVTGMRERAVYVGGTFSIDSAPGGGTRVRVLVPWVVSPPLDAEAGSRPGMEPGLDAPSSTGRTRRSLEPASHITSRALGRAG